jgi:hypothetical protein
MLRDAAHHAFDSLWAVTAGVKRGASPSVRADKARRRIWRRQRIRAYAWLTAQLGLPSARCHFGQLDPATLRRVIELCHTADPTEVRAFKGPNHRGHRDHREKGEDLSSVFSVSSVVNP